MVQFNTRANEILIKLVYYGPGLSGKTTNLQSLHAMSGDEQRGEMFSVNTQEDRTLFFDLLPINLGYIYGNAIHLQIYTVPGQVQYDASRRVVLGGADGVVFVADSSEAKMQENVDSLSNLYHNLNANRLNIKQIPFAIQYNKRDLPDAMPVGVMNRRLNFRSVPFFEAVANRGTGVLDTFLSITRETVGYTFKKYHLDKKIKDFDEMLNLIESNIRSSMHELPPVPISAGPAAESTVLRHSDVSVNDLAPNRVADAQDLLEDALKSNMETARLYSELKAVKDTLEKKNQETLQLNAQLERAGQDNLKTRKFLEGLIQNMGEALIAFGSDGKVLTWNAAAERMFGYQRQEIIGRPISALIPDSLVGELDQVIQQVAKGQTLRDVESTRLRKGGVTFAARTTYAPIRGSDDRVTAVSALVHDVEEQQLLTQQLATSKKNESMHRLLPGYFREVASRLTPVMLEARMLMESAMDPHQAEQATRMVQSIESTQRVIDPLLLMMSPPAPQRSAINLNRLVEESSKSLAPLAQRSGASLELNLDPAMPVSSMDASMMNTAIQNLFQNALHLMAQSPMKRLRIATRRSGESVQIAVQDSGPALSEAAQQELFLPNSARQIEGLAVPVAEVVARQHGGKLSVRSQEGVGNAFLMDLPLVAASGAPAQGSAPAVPVPSASASTAPLGLQGLRVLLVDDESFVRDALKEALQLWGCEVTPVAKGDEAAERLRITPFDLAISDIRMPGLSGIELYRWIQTNRPDLSRRVLFTTGDAFDAETQSFLESNQLSHLSKPFDLQRLKEKLEGLARIS
jgi:PAS domain S-box-containing protein